LGKASEKPVSNRRERGGSGLPQIASFLTEAPWEVGQVNERRLMVMNQCSQTRIRRVALIVDDSGQRKVAILQREWDGNTLEKSAKQIME
jgi:hypothetical protein